MTRHFSVGAGGAVLPSLHVAVLAVIAWQCWGPVLWREMDQSKGLKPPHASGPRGAAAGQCFGSDGSAAPITIDRQSARARARDTLCSLVALG